SNSSAESLDRLYPTVGSTKPPRKRTTSQCKSEPPLLRTSKRTIYTAGRPPWYNEHGTQSKEAFVIGLGGGSASGKTTVATMIIEALDVPWVVLLSMDSFYKVRLCMSLTRLLRLPWPLALPSGGDTAVVGWLLEELSSSLSLQRFSRHGEPRAGPGEPGGRKVFPVGSDAQFRWFLPMFPVLLAFQALQGLRRLSLQHTGAGHPCEPTGSPFATGDKAGLAAHLAQLDGLGVCLQCEMTSGRMALAMCCVPAFRQLSPYLLTMCLVFRAALASAHQCHPLPQTLSVLKSTPQVRGMHTIIRNKETSRDEFIFYSKRLMRLLIEHALSLLPFQSCTVQTPQGHDYEGRTYSGKQITGVSILRAGETMEPALRAVCKDVRIGTILIQTNCNTGEPELHYLRLPKDISEDHVILMDCTVSTGAAAMMAVRVLLDHDVPEDKIFLLSLLMAEMGVHSVAYAFPRVKIITTAVDKKVNDLFRIIPGIGNFGDRYFGTDAPPDWSDDEDALST
ncbi:UCKL1 protein, partial [Xiphorhynchus elegans]|nr:UCKL1 protein [Xiphorhynchus elegans]